eukprot:CAMPEP_0117677082 /NCGR_PEP_ID=MMETSP0804-20121206/16552_1 /TAXON_ID=1074897 /ORGANISM="Tetraselmis astigmatica, Strain CCMP880" /LENGTH=378 /DNA_ID=CAMNT_0005486335 /DNA_START=59 /DNA_END=1195 /DNA_ORIENTATION=+
MSFKSELQGKSETEIFVSDRDKYLQSLRQAFKSQREVFKTKVLRVESRLFGAVSLNQDGDSSDVVRYFTTKPEEAIKYAISKIEPHAVYFRYTTKDLDVLDLTDKDSITKLKSAAKEIGVPEDLIQQFVSPDQEAPEGQEAQNDSEAVLLKLLESPPALPDGISGCVRTLSSASGEQPAEEYIYVEKAPNPKLDDSSEEGTLDFHHGFLKTPENVEKLQNAIRAALQRKVLKLKVLVADSRLYRGVRLDNGPRSTVVRCFTTILEEAIKYARLKPNAVYFWNTTEVLTVLDLTDTASIGQLKSAARACGAPEGLIHEFVSLDQGAQNGTEADVLKVLKSPLFEKGISGCFRRTKSATLGCKNADEYDIFVEKVPQHIS